MDFTQPYVLVYIKYTAPAPELAIVNRYIENGYIPGQLITVMGGSMVQALYKPLVSNAIVGGTRKNKRAKRSNKTRSKK